MTKKYDSRCPVARTLNAIGDGWSVLILRDLFTHEKCRFQDLQKSLSPIVPSTLSQRLKRLEEDGIIDRKIYNDRPVRAEYELTEKGRTLGPVMLALESWGNENSQAK